MLLVLHQSARLMHIKPQQVEHRGEHINNLFQKTEVHSVINYKKEEERPKCKNTGCTSDLN